MRDIGERHARSRRVVLYLDEQHLTRDCVSRELSRHLPELHIDSRSSAHDLSPDDGRFALVILHTHGALIDNEVHSGRSDDSRVRAELSILEQTIPDTPLVLLSDTESTQNIVEAFQHRIRGYVPTTLPINLVAEAIRLISKGGTYIPPAILSLSSSLITAYSESVARPNEIASFSPRQSEVLHRLWLGKSNKSIAYELNMCESTVKVHIRSIMKKLKVNNRTQVVVMTRPLDHAPSVERDVRQRATSVIIEPLRASTVQPLLPKAEVRNRIRLTHGLTTIQARRDG